MENFNSPAGVAPVRPLAITIICVIGFLGALLSLPLALSPIARGIGAWYSPYLLLSAAIGLACMFGFWNMRKLAVFVYAGLTIVNQIVLLSSGNWNILALIVPAVIVGITASQLSKMR